MSVNAHMPKIMHMPIKVYVRTQRTPNADPKWSRKFGNNI